MSLLLSHKNFQIWSGYESLKSFHYRTDNNKQYGIDQIFPQKTLLPGTPDNHNGTKFRKFTFLGPFSLEGTWDWKTERKKVRRWTENKNLW